MEWNDILTGLAGTLVVALSGTGIQLLFSYIKNINLIKALNVEKLIDNLAETAVNYAEAWGRNLQSKGDKKLAVAREKFEAILKTHKVKFPPDLVEKRLEAVLNKLKPSIENKPVSNGGQD